MLRRKIDAKLLEWKNEKNHNPLIVKGVRQCGKTFSVTRFAENNYEHIIYMNFVEHPEYCDIFSGSLDIDNIIMMMEAYFGTKVDFVPNKTIIIFDEIQECPEARTSLKFFKTDGRYDVIATGSLLGVSGYREEPISVPVGYETVITMFSLDFEEFLWANGINDKIIDLLRESLVNIDRIPDAIHNRMRELLLQYTVVGGMPAVVSDYIDNKKMTRVLSMQRDIVRSYSDDMIKYANTSYKSGIKECFMSIPKQLSKENKKFQYSVIKKGSTSSKYIGCLQWIEDAGIINRCYNLSITELPLDGNAIQDVFKVYMADTGLFISMLEDGTQFDVLKGNLHAYKGAVFENLIADIFSKNQKKLYYYRKDSGLEIDFVTRYKNAATLIEVKATTGNTKSTRTILNHPEKYHVDQVIKLGDYNIAKNDKILTLPHYMAFLI